MSSFPEEEFSCEGGWFWVVAFGWQQPGDIGVFTARCRNRIQRLSRFLYCSISINSAVMRHGYDGHGDVGEVLKYFGGSHTYM